MSAIDIGRRALIFGVLAFAPLLAAGAASAQGPRVEGGWQAWLGCWQPKAAAASEAPPATEAPLVCVVPASRSAVEFVTIADGKVESRERVDASGAQVARNEEGCTGWERVQWSDDGRRVFRRSEQSCAGIQRHASGLQAILPDGEWLSVQSVSAGGNAGVRVVRYHPVVRSAGIPADVSRSVEGRALAVEAARLAAAAPLTTGDVVEASRHLDPDVVEAWLIERGQGFAVDARQLVELADAGVPERVIDVMVALSYPRVFAIDRESREGEFRPEDRSERPRGRRPGPVSIWDPWYYPDYGWGYGRRTGYGRGYGGPIIIVTRDRDDDDDKPAGRAVKGRGYTRGGGASGGAEPTSRPSREPSTSRSGDGSRSRGTSTGRTAKPRSGG